MISYKSGKGGRSGVAKKLEELACTAPARPSFVLHVSGSSIFLLYRHVHRAGQNFLYAKFLLLPPGLFQRRIQEIFRHSAAPPFVGLCWFIVGQV
jgi:hypothetical protein